MFTTCLHVYMFVHVLYTFVYVYLLNNYTHVCIFLYLANNLESNVKLFAMLPMYKIIKRSYRPVPGLFLAIHQWQ